MKRELFLRTDVLPSEIPILFSNKAVYRNFTQKALESLEMENETLHKFVTVPLHFYIPKSQKEERKIGLLHPLAQIQAFDYILKYEQLVISFCKNSPYSVRSPVKRNIPKIKMQQKRAKELKKLEEEFNFSNQISVTSDEDQVLFYNYFSYRKYKRIQNLYNSPKFSRDKYKYSYFLKLDIQRFFPSIYTHSLAWAIFGDKALAKKHMKMKKAFPNASDIISQKINFNETHGLVIGPEFSRVIAELLLTRVDTNLHRALNKEKLVHKKDYSLYRFVDDFFLFAHQKEDLFLIEDYLKRELNLYNLTLNVSKSEFQEKPFDVNDNSIIELKRILKEFEIEKKLALDIMNEEQQDNKVKFRDYKGRRDHWNNLFHKVEVLISKNFNSKTKIVNFFLKSIRSSINFDGNHVYVIINILEIISNVFVLDINNKSTSYLISIYFKILNQAKILEEAYQEEISCCNDSLKIKDYKNKINDLLVIEEKIFQYSFTILKNNAKEISNMYDLIVFMKMLNKKLSSSRLCEIINLHNSSYFVICSIAYYIINDKTKSLDMQFLTVNKKLVKIVNSNINNYVSKGAKYNILESDFFYLLNDFAKYPGFRTNFKDDLTKRLEREYKKTFEDNQKDAPKKRFIWESLTSYSYYEWESDPEDFIRKIVKKSSNTHLESSIDY